MALSCAQPLDVVPIPGTKRTEYVRENLAATNVPSALTKPPTSPMSSPPNRIVGDRYAPTHSAHTNAR
jgi:hypothetical protein